MCFFSPKPAQDESAAIARQQAQERETKINEGKGKIDSAFSVFDPAYFDKFKGEYLGYYQPQVDKQFGEARKSLRYNLARAGTQDSTPGDNAFRKLTEGYGDQSRTAASNALEATNKIRQQVEQNKSDLYAQNSASADPSLSAIQAVSRSGALQSPPSFSPIGDLFGGLINGGASYLTGQGRGLPQQYRGAFTPGASLPGNGSGFVVR